jgi:hypothetical protein
MLPRLLCFLSDVERALAADDPAPNDGRWDNSRTVNYHLDLARLCLAARLGDDTRLPRGIINLQGFTLADGTACLKAALTWTGSSAESVQAIYTKPGLNWTSEARRVAALWMGGPPAEATIIPSATEAAPASDKLAQVG